jgi:siroheme synthase
MVTGNIQNICELVRLAGLTNPAVVIIGDVVLSRQQLAEVLALKQAI